MAGIEELANWEAEGTGEDGARRWRGAFDPSWRQGRGAYGGLVAAVCMRGMREVVDEAERRPRSATFHFCAPALPDDICELAVRCERAGSSVTHLSARVRQGEEVATIATATFARDREESRVLDDLEMPEVISFEEAVAVEHNAMFPEFAQHFEFRFCGGGLPYSGSREARLAAWIRPRHEEEHDFVTLTAMLDTIPPAILPTLEAPRPAATVDLSFHYLVDAPGEVLAPGDPVLMTAHSRFGRGGYFEQYGEAWSRAGTPLAQIRQHIALI